MGKTFGLQQQARVIGQKEISDHSNSGVLARSLQVAFDFLAG